MKNLNRFIFLLSSIILLIALFSLGYTGRDDSHITYFVSNALAHGQGIINYNGDDWQQSSSLMLVLIQAFVSYITNSDPAFNGPILSFLFLLFSLLASIPLIKRKSSNYAPLLAFLTFPLIYWSLSGMEISLYVFLLVLLLNYFDCLTNLPQSSNIKRVTLSLIFVLSCLILTRPEFIFIFLGSLFLFFTFSRSHIKKHLALIFVASILITLFIKTFALNISFFPNTVTSKTSNLDLMSILVRDYTYLKEGIKSFHFTAMLATFFAMSLFLNFFVKKREEIDETFLFGFLILVMSFSFVMAVGGDWMENGRFLVIPIFLSLFLGLLYYSAKIRAIHIILFSIFLTHDVVTPNIFTGFNINKNYDYKTFNFEPSIFEFYNSIHSRDISFIDKTLGIINNLPRSEEKYVIASSQAGMVPYYLFSEVPEKLYFIDLIGLTTQYPGTDSAYCNQVPEFNSALPYAPFKGGLDILKAFECSKLSIDFIYDLDDENWTKLTQLLNSTNCKEVFRDSTRTLGHNYQFLADCRD